MALGFGVHLLGVSGFNYMREPLGAPWTCEVPWFDGWELAQDKRMKGSGYPLASLFFPDEVRKLHERFSQRVRPDGSIAPAENIPIIISEDDGSILLPGGPEPPTVAEVSELLADKRLDWVIIELWDLS